MLQEEIENTIIVLNGMKVICGLCRTEKETIDNAVRLLNMFKDYLTMNGVNELEYKND